ncbi:MAG: serine/threonine protein kinase [Kofleriaceae bacterium]|nr:serine/threonine protein kinase [Kofleriaceae bacterium]
MSCPDDNTLAAMAEHQLEPAMFAELEVHIDSCDHCRKVVAAALTARTLAVGTPQEGGSISDALVPTLDVALDDRYAIQAVLGRGGMGTVYLAHDRTLGRDVALKLHHRVGSASDRLHREAIAMAKLAHPNVVTVFEVATVEDRLYVAMEYVRGETLRGWLAAKPRAWRETVALLGEVGQGLAAAHAAGLVHRDFKPENVLVGEDSRPRVGDFGLARVGASPSGEAPKAALAETPLTQTGALLGTPAYMAPEQLAGDVVDARSDQFAFCVVAWECLYGKRPFGGTTLAALEESIRAHVLAAPAKSAVPARVRKVLERGLSLEPAARFADMPALLAALRDAARSRKTRWIATALAGVVLAGAAGTYGLVAFRERARVAACDAEATGVRSILTTPLETAISTQFLATGSPIAPSAYAHTIKVLGPYRDLLAARTVESCKRRDASPELSAARRTCLATHTRELAALVDQLAHPDASVVARAPSAAWGISETMPCDDLQQLLAQARRPAPDPVFAAELERAKGLADGGRYQESVPAFRALAAKAHAAGDRHFELDVLIALGNVAADLELPDVERTLEDAVALGESIGRDRDVASAYAALANMAGTTHRDYAAAHRYIGLARAKLSRLGGGNRVLEGELAVTEAQILVDENRLGEAERMAKQGVDLLELALHPQHPHLGAAYGTYAQILRAQNKIDEALAASRRTLEIFESALGAEHPSTAGAEMTLGSILMDRQAYAEARTRLDKADAVFARVYGDMHPVRAAIAGNIGSLEQLQEHWDAALDADRRALAILEATSGPDTLDASGARRDIATVLALAERYVDAIAEQERALAILDKTGADGESRLVGALVELAQMQLSLDRKAAARKTLERAISIGARRPADANPEELARARELMAAAGDRRF